MQNVHVPYTPTIYYKSPDKESKDLDRKTGCKEFL